MDSPAHELELGTDTLAIRALKDVSFGSLAGIASKIFEHPFDLTKVRLQSQVLDATARFNGPLDCLSQTFRNEGFRGLYRGLPAPIVGAMAENATLFWAYTELQHIIRWSNGAAPTQQLALGQLALAGAGAGTITSFVLTPIELVKCKMQVQMLAAPTAAGPLPGPLAVLASVVRRTGLRGLWLGHTGTLLRETGGGAAWFSAKESLAAALLARRGASRESKTELRPWESALAGAGAGVAYNLALFPADTVKSAMQTAAELRPDAPAPGFAGVAREMWRAGGLRGLYAGCGLTCARAVPSSALIFVIYDGLSKRFGG